MYMISILITAYKEEHTIAKAISTFISGLDDQKIDYEVILGCPDEATYNAALNEVKRLGIEERFVYVKDPGKGKPTGLNMMMDKARGDIWFFGDGDTYFGENVVPIMLPHFKRPKVMAVTGRPLAACKKRNRMDYYANLLADAAHHKRTVDLTENPTGKSLNWVKKRNFFPVSGYLFAMRASDIRVPTDTLVEDAYISYAIHNKGGRIEYEPRAKVYVKYPSNLSDFYKQRKRTVGGFVQLWNYGVVNEQNVTRSFYRELEYAWFPIKYASNIKELWWSLLLYPLRLWLWIKIFWERKVLKKDFSKTWVRIESTK